MGAPRSPSPWLCRPARKTAGTAGPGIQPSVGFAPCSWSLPLPQELLFPQETAAEGVPALRTLGARSLPEQSMHTEGREGTWLVWFLHCTEP